MKQLTFKDIYREDYAEGAILNEEFPGFKEDYLILHCLLKQYKPNTLFETGTNFGKGTKIIKNALGPESTVFSLDLPTESAHISLKGDDGKSDHVGQLCDLPFVQLRGDSMEFDYSKYPCEAYFIDGEHDYDHPYHETKEVLKNQPELIIWHDADMDTVYNAITDSFKGIYNYELYRVTDTRIAFAVKICETNP